MRSGEETNYEPYNDIDTHENMKTKPSSSEDIVKPQRLSKGFDITSKSKNRKKSVLNKINTKQSCRNQKKSKVIHSLAEFGNVSLDISIVTGEPISANSKP